MTATYDPGDGLAPYRRGVMLFMFNADGLIFCAKRADSDRARADEGWQVPQGGIDAGEDAAAAAARELGEEIGPLVRAAIVARYPEPLFYDFPDFVMKSGAFRGKYRGQMQEAFLLRYEGGAVDIGQGTGGEAPEFSAYEWKTPAAIRSLIVPFKKPLYDKALDYFAPLMISA